MNRIEHKICIGSLAAAASVWIIDAVVDTAVFHRGSFIDNLLFDVSPHEIYFRSFFLVLFVIFGYAVSRTVKKNAESAAHLRQLSAAIENSMDGIAIYNANDEYVYVNQAYSAVNGYDSPQDVIGRTCRNMYGEQEFERMRTVVVPELKQNGRWRGELIGRRKNGSSYFQEASVTLLEDGGRVCIVRDITWRKRSEERLLRSEQFLNTIFDSIRDPFCIFDSEFRIIRANEAYARLKDRSIEQLIGRRCYEVLQGRDEACEGCVVSKTFISADPCAKDKLVAMQDGSEIWVEIYTYPILDEQGRVTHVIEYTRDITDRKKSEDDKRRLIDSLEYLSRTDGLTGLLNRRALTDSMSYEMDRTKRYGSELSLILCDIDNFKEINDVFGHDMGDRALQVLSASLRKMLRKTDVAGRYGGDEFMVILPETSLAGAENLAAKMLSAARDNDLIVQEGRSLRLSLSIGVAYVEGGSDTIDALIKRADSAMYNSKQGGRDRVTTASSSDRTR